MAELKLKKKKKNYKKKRLNILKKKFKYHKIMKIKQSTEIISRINYSIKYIFFRRDNFKHKLPRFTYFKKRFFSKEIEELMFSYGDSGYPLLKTVMLVENFVINFLKNLASSISYISFWRIKKRPTIDDLFFCFRNRSHELSKIKYLIKMKSLIQNIIDSDKKGNLLKQKIIFPPNILKLK